MHRPMLSRVVHWLLMVVFSFLGQAIAQLSENDPHSAGTGDWSQEIDACIPGNNNMVIDGLSFGTCKALCQAQMEFECRSVEYYSRTRRCQLSTATRTSPSFRQPCHINGWTFTEVARWSPPIDACIRGNNNEVIENISFDACKTRCQASPCRSIEYHSRDRRCSHSTVTSSSPSYRQPCHIPGWTFTELVVPVSCPEPLCNCNSNTIIVWEVTADGCNSCRCIRIPPPCPSPLCICRPSYNVQTFTNENGCEVCRCVPKARWTRGTNACIRGNNNLRLNDLSLDDCKDRCQVQTEFDCRSVEYHSSSRRCWLSTETSQSSSYNQPCHNRGWTFTEIIGECSDNWPQSAVRAVTLCNNGINAGGCYRSCADAQANGGCRGWIANEVCPRTCGTCNNAVTESCPRGYEEVLNQCLNIDDSESQTWLEASSECRRSGGYLATTKNPRQLSDFILENYPRKTFWIGGSDEEREGLWVWESGDAVGRNFPWGKNNQGRQQPENSRNNEDCMALKFFRNRRGNPRRTVYVDNRCTIKHHHICEADKIYSVDIQ